MAAILHFRFQLIFSFHSSAATIESMEKGHIAYLLSDVWQSVLALQQISTGEIEQTFISVSLKLFLDIE